MGAPKWTDDELALLADMYPHCHTDDVAVWLARSLKSVYEQAKQRGVRKTAEYLASDSACRIRRGRQDARMLATQFRPGTQPWNKGKPGATGLHENCRKTQFKKGHKNPSRWVPIGSHRICADGLLERKVTDLGRGPRDWVAVHRLVWKEHAEIPAGHIVVFRPGMRTNKLEEITRDRLECISRAENARRNHPKNRSPELAKLYQLKGAITRQLHRIEKEHGNTAHQPTA